jgi:hypothetical protein
MVAASAQLTRRRWSWAATKEAAMPNGDAVAAARARAKDRALVEAQARLVGTFGRTVLGVVMLLLGGAVLYLMIALWPAVQEAAKAGTGKKTVTWFGWDWTPTPDAALLALVVLSSALGSYVHAAVSFTDYVGNRLLARSWVWWYLLRVLVGSSLALLFYFVIRGGFLGAGTQSSDINPYGIAAISGLVGLFSKQATDKLSEVFDTAFAVEKGGDKARSDGITNPVPALTASEPLRLKRGVLEFALMGSGFIRASSVHVEQSDGTAVPLTIIKIEPQRIALRLDVDDLDAPGTLRVSVVNPEPGGGTSDPLVIPVDPDDVEGTQAGSPPGPGPATVVNEPAQPETGAELEPDDHLDGCELDFTEQPTSDEDAAALIAPPAGPMKEQSEEDWEREEGS